MRHNIQQLAAQPASPSMSTPCPLCVMQWIDDEALGKWPKAFNTRFKEQCTAKTIGQRKYTYTYISIAEHFFRNKIPFASHLISVLSPIDQSPRFVLLINTQSDWKTLQFWWIQYIYRELQIYPFGRILLWIYPCIYKNKCMYVGKWCKVWLIWKGTQSCRYEYHECIYVYMWMLVNVLCRWIVSITKVNNWVK